MSISHLLAFALGACIGGFAVVIAVAFCVVAAEAGARAAEECELASFVEPDETGGE